MQHKFIFHQYVQNDERKKILITVTVMFVLIDIIIVILHKDKLKQYTLKSKRPTYLRFHVHDNYLQENFLSEKNVRQEY